jgi:hypothetical protein
MSIARSVRAAILVTVSSRLLVTQRSPSPLAIAAGACATGIRQLRESCETSRVPADPPRTDDERRALGMLIQPDRRVADRTLERIAEAVGMVVHPTWDALRSLETRRPQLVHPQVDATLDLQFWATTSHVADSIHGE